MTPTGVPENGGEAPQTTIIKQCACGKFCYKLCSKIPLTRMKCLVEARAKCIGVQPAKMQESPGLEAPHGAQTYPSFTIDSL